MTAKKSQPAKAESKVSWTRGGWHGRGALKFLGARRGDGLLVCSQFAIPAAYQIDVFAQGEAHSVNGALEGDFSPLVSDDPPGDSRIGSARLRLDDGREIDIRLVDIEPSSAGFDVRDERLGADLLLN